MVKVITAPKQGCEKLVAIFDEAISEIENAKQTEIDKAIAEINAKYDIRLTDYRNDREHYIDKVEVEVPDEIVPENDGTQINII